MDSLYSMIYEYVANNPGCTTADIKKAIQEEPRKIENRIRRMSGRTIRRISSARKYVNKWAVV